MSCECRVSSFIHPHLLLVQGSHQRPVLFNSVVELKGLRGKLALEVTPEGGLPTVSLFKAGRGCGLCISRGGERSEPREGWVKLCERGGEREETSAIRNMQRYHTMPAPLLTISPPIDVVLVHRDKLGAVTSSRNNGVHATPLQVAGAVSGEALPVIVEVRSRRARDHRRGGRGGLPRCRCCSPPGRS